MGAFRRNFGEREGRIIQQGNYSNRSSQETHRRVGNSIARDNSSSKKNSNSRSRIMRHTNLNSSRSQLRSTREEISEIRSISSKHRGISFSKLNTAKILLQTSKKKTVKKKEKDRKRSIAKEDCKINIISKNAQFFVQKPKVI